MTIKKVLVASLLLMGTAAMSFAVPLSFSGTFSMDDDVVLIPFTVPSLSLVTIQTTSFANGSTGFEPVLTLYDQTGNLLFVDQGGTAPGGCGARSIDPTSTYCLDAYIQSNLGAGDYTVALTQYDNVPSGSTLADGFPQTGNGNFTGPNFLGSAGSFILFDGSQRTSAWALDINGVAIPEPGTFSLSVCSILALLAGRKFFRRNRAA